MFNFVFLLTQNPFAFYTYDKGIKIKIKIVNLFKKKQKTVLLKTFLTITNIEWSKKKKSLQFVKKKIIKLYQVYKIKFLKKKHRYCF